MVIKSENPHSFAIQQRPWTPTKRRGPIAAEYTTPGPAAVSLPSTIGLQSHDSVSNRSKSPAFSFGARHEDKKDIFVPGPGAYNITGLCHTGREANLAPTLSGRTRDPAPFKTPAPGAYSPEKSGPGATHHAPAYSFGLKTRDAKPDMTPGPNVYKIQGTVGNEKDTVHKKTPSYSMGMKSNDALWNGAGKNSPGPGRYDIPGAEAYKSKKSPSYTLSGRTLIPGDRTQKPGPGAHSPEKVVFQQTPSYSFGIRHSQFAHNIDKTTKAK